MSQGFTKGIPIDTDVALTANSDNIVSSQKAVKAYVDAYVDAIAGVNKVGLFTLQSVGGAGNPADLTTYYQGLNLVFFTTNENSHKFNVGFAFKIIGAIISAGGNSVAGTTEDSVLQIRNVTQATSSSIGNFKTNGSSTVSINTTFTELNISVAASDLIALQIDTPAWVTNPTNIRIGVTLICIKS